MAGCESFCTAAKCAELETKITALEAKLDAHLGQSIPTAHAYTPDVQINVVLTAVNQVLGTSTTVFIDGVSASDNDSVSIQGLKGDKGDKGEQGLKGEKGDKGDKGEQGEKGDKGDKGDQGEKGGQGFPGPPGDKGEQGEQGFHGFPGEKGASGPPGSPGEKGEAATFTPNILNTFIQLLLDSFSLKNLIQNLIQNQLDNLLEDLFNKVPYSEVTLEILECELVVKSLLVQPGVLGKTKTTKSISIVNLKDCLLGDDDMGEMKECCDKLQAFLQFLDNQMTSYTVQILDAIKKVKCENDDIITKIDKEFNEINNVTNNIKNTVNKLDVDLGGITVKLGNVETNLTTNFIDIITKLGYVDVKIGDITTQIGNTNINIGYLDFKFNQLINIDNQITIDVQALNTTTNLINACCDEVNKKLPPIGGGGNSCDKQFDFNTGYPIYIGACVENTDETTKTEFPKIYQQQSSTTALSAAHALNLLSTQVEKIHTDLCRINTEGGEDTVLLPDPDVIKSAKGKYIVFTWVLEENPSLKRYKSVTQLPDPIDALWKDVTSNQASAIWNAYFENIYKFEGEQFSVFWSNENGRTPLTRGYFKDKTEAERYFNSINTLTKKTPRPENNPVYSDVRNQTYKPSNINKKFILHSVSIIDKLENSDECSVLIKYKNPNLQK